MQALDRTRLPGLDIGAGIDHAGRTTPDDLPDLEATL
jgi:hypothetical protein